MKMNKEQSIVYAIGIKRVSSTKQGLMGDSPEDQKIQITNRAEQLSSVLGHRIVIKEWFEFIESASGELDVQPILKAHAYCKDPSNKIKYAIIKSIDRGTRGGATTYGQLKSLFARSGVQFVDVYGVIGTSNVNTLDHLGIEYEWSNYSPTWITELLEAERAKGEVRDILTRMIGAEIRYVRMGYRVRPAPPGYINKKIETIHGIRTILEPHPQEANWFIRMFQLRAQGNLTDSEIVNEINALGYKSRIQKTRSAIDRTKIIGYKGGNQLTIKQYRKYIENPIYAGINTEKWTNGNPVKGKFMGLVDIKTFNEANKNKITIVEEGDVIKIYKGKPAEWQLKKDKNNPNFPYKNYFYCPHCLRNPYASASKSKSGRHIPRYHCNRNHTYWSINTEKFASLIKSFVAKVELDDKFIVRFSEIVLEEWEKREKSLSLDTLNLGKQIEEKEKEIQQIKESIKKLTSFTTIKMMEEDIEKLQIEKMSLSSKKTNDEKKQIDIQVVINNTKYYLEHLDELIFGGTNKDRNAAMFGLLFEDTPSYEELHFGTPKLAPIFKLNDEYKKSKELSVSDQGLEP